MSKKFLLVNFLAFFVAVLITYLSGDYDSLAVHFWNLAPSLIAVICGVLAVKVYGIGNPHAKALFFLSLGIFLWFIGDFIWFILEYFLEEKPFPSIADYFYLLSYPLLLVGLIQELKSNKLKWTYCKVIASVSLSLLFGVVVFYFGVIRAYDPLESLLNNTIAIFYGIGDLVLIIFTVAILMIVVGYQKGKLFWPWLSILVGFSSILASDILFAIYRDKYENFIDIYRNIDLGWILGFLFIGYGFFSIKNTLKEAEIKLLEKSKKLSRL